MRLRISAYLCAIGSLLTPYAHSESILAQEAPLFYTVNADSETVDSWSLGLVSGLVGEAYRKSHAKFLAALQSNASDGSEHQRLLKPFACLGFDPSSEQCRRLIEVKNGISDQEMIALLSAEPTRSARVVELRIIFDGRFFQVPTRLYDLQLTGDALVRSHELIATYITTYSRSLHQTDIATSRNDAHFEGKIGSKEARTHFWLGGSSPRLSSELGNSVQSLANLWATVLSPEASGVFSGDHSDRASLPRVRDVVAKTATPCKTLHGNFLVAKDLGDYLWLTPPGSKKDLWNTFFIEPRCGFDY